MLEHGGKTYLRLLCLCKVFYSTWMKTEVIVKGRKIQAG
jgi:hypothetical protein